MRIERKEEEIMYEKYLIQMNDPKDWIRHWDEGTQVVNDFTLPRGPYEKDEMSDTIYHKDATVPYHQQIGRASCRDRV